MPGAFKNIVWQTSFLLNDSALRWLLGLNNERFSLEQSPCLLGIICSEKSKIAWKAQERWPMNSLTECLWDTIGDFWNWCNTVGQTVDQESHFWEIWNAAKYSLDTCGLLKAWFPFSAQAASLLKEENARQGSSCLSRLAEKHVHFTVISWACLRLLCLSWLANFLPAFPVAF